MSIIGGMIESNNVALNNPLSGDRDAALKYDIMNYDKLFLGIPLDRCELWASFIVVVLNEMILETSVKIYSLTLFPNKLSMKTSDFFITCCPTFEC